jgi:hypothetical protein
MSRIRLRAGDTLIHMMMEDGGPQLYISIWLISNFTFLNERYTTL